MGFIEWRALRDFCVCSLAAPSTEDGSGDVVMGSDSGEISNDPSDSEKRSNDTPAVKPLELFERWISQPGDNEADVVQLWATQPVQTQSFPDT